MNFLTDCPDHLSYFFEKKTCEKKKKSFYVLKSVHYSVRYLCNHFGITVLLYLLYYFLENVPVLNLLILIKFSSNVSDPNTAQMFRAQIQPFTLIILLQLLNCNTNVWKEQCFSFVSKGAN